ncbi:MAG: hypothetical protein ACK559_10750, partial [bacterium]
LLDEHGVAAVVVRRARRVPIVELHLVAGEVHEGLEAIAVHRRHHVVVGQGGRNATCAAAERERTIRDRVDLVAVVAGRGEQRPLEVGDVGARPGEGGRRRHGVGRLDLLQQVEHV